jgi:hypothetical protein
MFCSEACKDEAFDSFHGYECRHIDGLMLSKDYLWFSLAIKSLFQATSLCGDDIADLQMFLSEKLSDRQKSIKVMEKIFGLSDYDSPNAKHLLKNSKLSPQTATLWDYEWNEHDFEEYKRLLVANAIDVKLKVEYRNNKGMQRLVQQHIKHFPIIARGECDDFATNFMLKQSNNILVKSEKSSDGSFWTWCGGIYLLRNYMAFGCMPNVKGFMKDGGDMILIVTAPIVANGTLFIDYE